MDFSQIDHTVLIDKVLPVYNEHKLPTTKAFKTDIQDVPKGVPYAGWKGSVLNIVDIMILILGVFHLNLKQDFETFYYGRFLDQCSHRCRLCTFRGRHWTVPRRECSWHDQGDVEYKGIKSLTCSDGYGRCWCFTYRLSVYSTITLQKSSQTVFLSKVSVSGTIKRLL